MQRKMFLFLTVAAALMIFSATAHAQLGIFTKVPISRGAPLSLEQQATNKL
jgi:hypothetical protein